MKSKVKIRSSNVSVLIKEGVFFTGKNVSVSENKGPFLACNHYFRGIFKF